MKGYIIQTKALDAGEGMRQLMGKGGVSMTPIVHKAQIKQLCPPSPLRTNLPPLNMSYSTIYS